MAGLPRPAKVGERERVLTDHELRRTMAAAAARRGAALSIDEAVRRTEDVYHELAMAAPGR